MTGVSRLNLSKEIEIFTDSTTVIDVVEEVEDNRGKWQRNIDFLFACLGFSVGFGNVWRFPFLCFKNGGGAFLIPYFIAVLLTGIPLFFMEVSLGQLMSRGGIEAWEIIPLFKGVGYAGVFVLFCLNCYYNVILAWILFYLFSSMNSVLPWNSCNSWWNTENCQILSNASGNPNTSKHSTDPVTEFWERRVLGISSGIEVIGGIQWELALCLLLAWMIVFLCIFKGIRASGKVLYITATSPFILMFILIVRTACLEGAREGMIYYLKPNWTHLASIEVWSDAGTQIFFSYSISLGTLTALGSFNNFHHKSVRDTGLFALLNSCTSFAAGCIIFSTLGFMSHTSGIPISDVAESGPGLAFIAYPKALSTMPLSPLWSVLFFTMLLLLGLDSQFVGVEGFVTSCVDMFPTLLSDRHNRVLFTIATCMVCYCVGLLMVTQGGIYIFQLFDYYVGSRIILLIAFFECIVLGYFLGVKKFSSYLRKMYSMNFTFVTAFIYCGIAPAFSMALFVMSVVVYGKLEYKHSTGTYEYPQYSVIIGWLLASCSIFLIPVVAIYRLCKAEGTLFQRLQYLCRVNLTETALKQLAALDGLIEDNGNGVDGKEPIGDNMHSVASKTTIATSATTETLINKGQI